VKKQGESDVLIIELYIDDLVIMGSNGRWIEEFMKEMIKRYEINEMGLLHHFLGIKVYQDDDDIIC
jgi:hypothetical protein